MLTYTDAMAHLERHKDLLREAENERLAKIAAAARSLKLKLKEAKRRKEKAESAAVTCCKTETT